MSPELAGNYLAAVLSTAVVGVLIPAGILIALLAGLRTILRTAQSSPEGFMGRMLSDAEGKPSSDRMVKLVAVCITSWMASVVVFAQPQLITETMIVLGALWGGIDLTKHWLTSRVDLAAAKQETK